jgi:hypothetical protein
VIGKIFITRTGYDPVLGKHVKDPYLGDNPSLGACRPDFRHKLQIGDHLFTISGKVPNAKQFVMCGFEVAEKITAIEAYWRFPEQHLQMRDGHLTGNVVVDAQGAQHALDTHKNFPNRISDYIVGKNGIVLRSPEEIARGREETLDVLREILKKKGESPIQIVGRWGCELTEEQVRQLRVWLRSLKITPGKHF